MANNSEHVAASQVAVITSSNLEINDNVAELGG